MQRIKILPLPNGKVTCLGRSFPDSAAAEAWAREAIKRREAIAGRTLSANELLLGVDHADDLDLRTRIAANNWAVPMAAVDDESDPFDDPVLLQAKGPLARQSFDGPKNRKELAQAAREQYAKRTGQTIVPQDVVDAREYSLQVWEQAAFDPSQPASAVVKAEQLKQAAWTDGADLAAWQSAAQEFANGQQQRYQQQVAAAELERQQAEARVKSIPRPIGAPGGVQLGDKVSRMTRVSDGAVTYDVVNNGVLRASYPESEAPADVIAAAN